jgi:SAM-dependent methyltransferase
MNPTVYENNRRYFDKRLSGLTHFFDRFPEPIDFQGKRVLDFGCGHGALTYTAANSGAAEVLGVDINERLVEFAQENQKRRFPETEGVLRFECRDILDSDLSDFDIVLSEATFEHVIGLDRYLEAIRNILKPGGRLYTGYSPLYNSPWGDHHRLKAPMNRYLPWTHLIFPQRWLFSRLSTDEKAVRGLEDVGLNGMSFAAHRERIHNANMRVIHFSANNTSRPAMKAIEVLRGIPGLRELLTFSIYAVLEKPPEGDVPVRPR